MPIFKTCLYTDKRVHFPINSLSHSRVSCDGGCSLLNGNTIGFYFKLMTQDLESVPIMLLFHKDSITQGLSTKPASFTSILCTRNIYLPSISLYM